jgi:hypothetical protein
MANEIKFSADGTLALTVTEINAMQYMLDAHDRAGFYMTYYAMTDSAEAGLQSRIATFSGDVGGASLTANRLAQVQIGPDTAANNYPAFEL